MAKTAKRQTGDIGEEVACKYLENKGFSVMERNYLRKWGEIDIIAQKDINGAKRLYFIEVKTVSRESSVERIHLEGLSKGGPRRMFIRPR
jgi:Holliday junction resolvase-like predicted endonuclease